MVLHRYNAGLAENEVLIGLDPISISSPVEQLVLALATPDAWIASITELLVKKGSRGGRRQKDYTEAFAELLSMAENQLIGFDRQLVRYRHSEEFKVSTESDPIEVHNNCVLTMLRSTKQVVALPTVSKPFSTKRVYRFNLYVCTAFKDIRRCYIAELADELKSLYRLECNAL